MTSPGHEPGGRDGALRRHRAYTARNDSRARRPNNDQGHELPNCACVLECGGNPALRERHRFRTRDVIRIGAPTPFQNGVIPTRRDTPRPCGGSIGSCNGRAFAKLRVASDSWQVNASGATTAATAITPAAHTESHPACQNPCQKKRPGAFPLPPPTRDKRRKIRHWSFAIVPMSQERRVPLAA